jgi:hypothetical protein
MKLSHKKELQKKTAIGLKAFEQYLRRRSQICRRKKGIIKFYSDVASHAIKNGRSYYSPFKKEKKARRREIKRKNTKFENCLAPEKLTLKYEHCEDVIDFINRLKKLGKKGKNLNLLMDNITEIGEGAICMLLSVIDELKKTEILIKGTKPLDKSIKNHLEKSGFFKSLRTVIDSGNLNTKNTILTTGDQFTNSEEVAYGINLAMETVWNVKARCPLLYGGVGEMQRNSCDHAFSEEDSIVWHFGISHFEDLNLVKFSFVDNGAGIINSYTSKDFFKIIRLSFKDNAEFLQNAFFEGIDSKTGLNWRGTGLPTIFEMYSEKIITRLVVITNQVYLDFDKGITKEIKSNFSGTYYYWEINKNCTPSYFI